MLLLSPEQLTSRCFDHLLQKKAFSERIVALGLDEMHLVMDWGNAGFRESFRQIGLVLARLPQSTTFLGVTATLPKRQTSPLTLTLGLKPGSFFFNRRSNLRTDVRLIFRVLRHGLGGWYFPDLKWIVEGARKTIIYCDTISLAFRFLVYLWHCLPTSPQTCSSRIRLYCSLCFASYNERTRQLFVEDPNLQVLIATDSLKVGNDFPNVADVVVLNPKDPSDIVQKTGRAGRASGRVSNPRGIVYVTKTQVERAKSLINGGNILKGKKITGRVEDEKMSPELARIITADCHTSELNCQFDNPDNDPLCKCETCLHTPSPSTSFPANCNCSGPRCDPEPTLPPLPRSRAQHPFIAMSQRLTEEMRQAGEQQLVKFRWDLWDHTLDLSLQYAPPSVFLPDPIIKNILDNFALITTVDDAAHIVEGVSALDGHHDSLFNEVCKLQELFSAMRKAQSRQVEKDKSTQGIKYVHDLAP